MGTNRLLDALPRDSASRIGSQLEVVDVHPLSAVFPDDRIERVYFPLDSVASLVISDDDGRGVEVGTIGREGVVGLPAYLGSTNMPMETIWQIGGRAGAVALDVLLAEAKRSHAVSDILDRYSRAVTFQAMQSVACHRLHPAEERAARWLLETHDRVDGDRFGLTHEVLAFMVGTSRPTTTIAVGLMQRAGLIKYHRGAVTILDRRALEDASCDCYQTVRSEFDRLLRPPASEPRRLPRVNGSVPN